MYLACSSDNSVRCASNEARCREEGRPEPFVWQQDGSEGVSSDGATVALLDQRIVLTPPSDDAKDAYLVALVEKHFR